MGPFHPFSITSYQRVNGWKSYNKPSKVYCNFAKLQVSGGSVWPSFCYEKNMPYLDQRDLWLPALLQISTQSPQKKDIPKPVYYIFHVFRGFHVIHRCLPSTSTPSTPMAPFPFGVPTILRNFWTSPGRSRSAEFESWSIQLSEAIQAPPTPTQQVQHSTAVVGQFVPLGRSSQKSATKRNM